MPFENGHIIFNVAEAYEHGVCISKNGFVESPPGTKYCLDSKCIILPNGESFPVVFKCNPKIDVPNTRIDYAMLSKLQFK